LTIALALHSFLESNGWYVLAALAFTIYMYRRFVHPAVLAFEKEKELRAQKKFGEPKLCYWIQLIWLRRIRR